MKKRICCDCGKEFYGASNAKRCPACREIREHRRLPPSEVDDLMLDVREADAAGLSYGQWRAQKLMGKLKASDARKRKSPEQCEHTFRITDQECIVCSGRNNTCKRYRPCKPKEKSGPGR